MKKYLTVVEKADGNYSAYVPDLPGCVATGNTKGEAKREIAAAIRLHIQGLIDDGLSVPEPSASADVVSVP